MHNKELFSGIVMGLLASMIWGSWPVISKLAQIHSLSPVEITLLRFFISGAVLLPVLWRYSVSLKDIGVKGLALAIGAGVPYVLFSTYGISYSSSAHFGIIAPSTMLVFSTIGSVYLLSEKLTKMRILGVLLILLGVVVVGGSSLTDINGQAVIGDLMFVGSGALWASYTLLCKYWRLNAWVATAMVSVVSGMICIPIYASASDQFFQGVAWQTLLIHGLFQGVLVAILALYSYSKSVSLLGAAKGAVFAALVPPFAIILGMIILSEPITAIEIVGMTCVFLGMLLALGVITLPKRKLDRIGSLN